MERRQATDEWGDWRVALAESTGADVDAVPLEGRGEASEAPAAAANLRRSRLGQLMVERNLVTEEQLAEGLAEQRSTGRRLGETLVERGVISSDDLAAVLADHLGVPFVDLRDAPPDLVLAAADPRRTSRAATTRCPSSGGASQVVDRDGEPERRVRGRRPPRAHRAPGRSRRTRRAPAPARGARPRVQAFRRVESSLGDATSDVDTHGRDAAAVRLRHRRSDGAARRRAARAGLPDKASDLHIEPTTDKVIIRLRIDGVLHDTSEAPLERAAPDGQPAEGASRQSRHRAAPSTPGRPLLGDAAGPAGRRARRDDPDRRRASRSCCACSTATRGVIDLPSLGLSSVRELMRFVTRVPRRAGRRVRHGPDRIGQDVDALCGALARSAIETRASCRSRTRSSTGSTACKPDPGRTRRPG